MRSGNQYAIFLQDEVFAFKVSSLDRRIKINASLGYGDAVDRGFCSSQNVPFYGY
jgi:hypothetical protein